MSILKIRLNDRLVSRDTYEAIERRMKDPGQHIFRTEVTAYDDFGKVLFSKRQNETVLGGAVTVLEKLTGIQAPHKTASINHLLGINDTVDITQSSAGVDDFVCLWGVGIGGAGDAFGSRLTVNFFEREIGQNGHTDQMIPFRVVANPFTPSDDEYSKYFMRRQRTSDGLYEYYLKGFETAPVIKTLWQDGAEGEDGSEIEDDIYNTTREDKIDVFMQMQLRITKNDIREYFEQLGKLEQARFNTIGLFTGRKYEIEAGRYEYSNVKLFTKLTLENEPLANAKSLLAIYNIYVS